jgi:hypothetical protein
VIGVGAVAFAGRFLLPVALRGFVRAVELGLAGAVWVAASIDAGADAWTIATAILRAGARALLTPRVLGIVGGLVLLGAVAMYGLQRLLGLEED